MRKNIFFLTLTVILAFCSIGCHQNSTVQNKFTEDGEKYKESHEEIPVSSSCENEQFQNPILADLSDFAKTNPHNKTKTVSIFAPGVQNGGSCCLHFLLMKPQDVYRILRSEDKNVIHTENADGMTILENDTGLQFSMNGDQIRLQRKYDDVFQRLIEIKNLFTWKAEHDQSECRLLQFRSPEDVQRQCEGVLKDLGICFTPKLETFLSMTHGEAMELQQKLLGGDPVYNSFGNACVLQDLDASYDCYYLSYIFEYDGIPLYGADHFPKIPLSMGPQNPVPQCNEVYARFLVSEDGIIDAQICGAFGQAELQSKQPIISGRTAAEYACTQLDQDLTRWQSETDNRVESVSLNYVPMFDTDENQFIMQPVWGAEIGAMMGTEWMSDFQGGEIFLNAFSGLPLE